MQNYPLGFGDEFLDKPPKAQFMKGKNKFHFIKMKTSNSMKASVKRIKIKGTDRFLKIFPKALI